MKTQIIEIRTGSIGLKKKISVIQEDSARQLKCILTDFAIPDESAARIYAVKPSGNKIFNDGVIEDTNTVLIDMTTQLLAEVGEVTCQVEITESSGNILTSFEFTIEVKKRLKDSSAIESTNEYSALEAALGKVQNIDSKISGMINDDVISRNSTFSSEKIQKMGFSTAKANLIKEATTVYGGGFRLYSMGSLLIVENIEGPFVTGSVTDEVLFTYDDDFPKVTSDQTYDVGNGISISLTTNRELRYTASSGGSYHLTSGIELFMSDSLSEGGEVIESNSIMINAVDNYSTEEHIVGTWIDNKPLYEKTVYISSLPATANQYTSYAHNIEDIDTICTCSALAYFASGNTAILNHISSSSSNDENGAIGYTVDKTNILIAPRADRSSMHAYINIRYTKVEDTPITPQTSLENAINQTTFSSLETENKDLVGAINEVNKSHLYSTEEQVVGIWIDGRPVYQKTLVGTITQATTALDIGGDYNILEIDGIIVRNSDGVGFNCRCQDGDYSIDIKANISNQILILLSDTIVITSWLTSDNNAYVTIKYTKSID